jgi:hypothetical protein
MNQLLYDEPLPPTKKRKPKTKRKENDTPQPIITKIKLPDNSKEDKKITGILKVTSFDSNSRMIETKVISQRKYLKSMV